MRPGLGFLSLSLRGAEGASTYDIHKIVWPLPFPPCLYLDLNYAIKFKQPPLLLQFFHDPPSDADIISDSSLTETAQQSFSQLHFAGRNPHRLVEHCSPKCSEQQDTKAPSCIPTLCKYMLVEAEEGNIFLDRESGAQEWQHFGCLQTWMDLRLPRICRGVQGS